MTERPSEGQQRQLTPFERQLELVRHGKARVVRNVPIKAANDHAFTLGGVSCYGR